VSIGPTDAELIEGCLRREEGPWRDLIKRYRRLIYSIPVAYRSADPDEIFQIVAVKLFENLATLRNHGGVAAWIATTTRRECMAAARKGKRSVSIDEQPEHAFSEPPPDVAQTLLDIECEHMLHLALEGLGGMCETLLKALYLEDPTPSYKEISRRIERPVGSLGPTRARCLTKLKELYFGLGGKSPQGVSIEPVDAH